MVDQASSNTIVGNYIGTDPDGTSAVANTNGGVQIVGGPEAANLNSGSFNVISGNGNTGLLIDGASNSQFSTTSSAPPRRASSRSVTRDPVC